MYCRGAIYIQEYGVPDDKTLDMWCKALNIPSDSFDGLSVSEASEKFAIAGIDVARNIY
jgi:hypothetical protein